VIDPALHTVMNFSCLSEIIKNTYIPAIVLILTDNFLKYITYRW